MRTGLSIGDFSRITHLSVKMLRRYHEAGLLEPADVDAQTGYRYYSTDQVPTAQVIRQFRELGMPVREVREIVSTADLDERGALISRHLERLERELDQTRAAVTSLRRLLQPAAAPLDVRQRREPARAVAAIRGRAEHDEVLARYAGAMAELDHVIGAEGLVPTGPPGGLYDNELFTDERGSVLVYLPVAEPPAAGRVQPFVIPAAELATTVHRGPHDDIDVTYGALGTYVTEQALVVAGPVHEIYLVGPRDTSDATAWRTEIGWPVFRVSPV